MLIFFLPDGGDELLLVANTQLRKLGPDASAAKLHEYLVNLTGWTGVNGPYNFRANPQRGIGENNILMVKFDGAADFTSADSSAFECLCSIPLTSSTHRC